MRQLKENRVVSGGMTMAEFVARRLCESVLDFSDFLGRDRGLVPIPRSSLQRSDTLWPARDIAMALHTHGKGHGVFPCLTRTHPVPKAAISTAKDRPKAADHLASLQATNAIDLPPHVTLIDDVITRGAQAMGAAWAIWKVRPDVSIRVFAVLRTISNEGEFLTVLAPTVGLVSVKGVDAYRVP